ncbi:MAG: CRTAC1 family protein [Proteobacteria bacterium]|nr:CRTAC1 family protein [Pseudomonadota bacterium]
MSLRLMLLLAAVLLTACGPSDDDDSSPVDDDDSVSDDDDSSPSDDDDATPPPDTPEHFEVGDAVACTNGSSGWNRFSEEGALRGLDLPFTGQDAGGFFEDVAGIVAHDLDDDGDVDLIGGQDQALPLVWLNDGAAQFTLQPEIPHPSDGGGYFRSALLAAADLDGDRLPELVTVDDVVTVWPNLGDGSFGPPALYDPEDGRYFSAMTIGDPDGDGDLDVLAANGSDGPDEVIPPGDWFFLGDGTGSLTRGERLLNGDGHGISSLVPVFTDRDFDGDQDILEPNNTGNATKTRSMFWRNETPPGGAPTYVDDGAEVGVDEGMAGMGVDSADLNRDGWLDYCVTDSGPTACFYSVDSDTPTWLDATAAAGLRPDEPAYEDAAHVPSIGWSFDFADLDSDGFVDAVQTGAPDHGSGLRDQGFVQWPDLMWRGVGDGTFVEVTEDAGYGTTEARFGLATADFDGDGSLDIVTVGPGIRPELYMNRCNDDGGWISVDFVGPPANTAGYGAIVHLTDSRGTQIRELYSVRATGQSWSRLHLGLGADPQAERLTVVWPDGTLSSIPDVPARTVVTVTHPDAR